MLKKVDRTARSTVSFSRRGNLIIIYNQTNTERVHQSCDLLARRIPDTAIAIRNGMGPVLDTVNFKQPSYAKLNNQITLRP
jgi:hypothetical protein